MSEDTILASETMLQSLFEAPAHSAQPHKAPPSGHGNAVAPKPSQASAPPETPRFSIRESAQASAPPEDIDSDLESGGQPEKKKPKSSRATSVDRDDGELKVSVFPGLPRAREVAETRATMQLAGLNPSSDDDTMLATWAAIQALAKSTAAANIEFRVGEVCDSGRVSCTHWCTTAQERTLLEEVSECGREVYKSSGRELWQAKGTLEACFPGAFSTSEGLSKLLSFAIGYYAHHYTFSDLSKMFASPFALVPSSPTTRAGIADRFRLHDEQKKLDETDFKILMESEGSPFPAAITLEVLLESYPNQFQGRPRQTKNPPKSASKPASKSASQSASQSASKSAPKRARPEEADVGDSSGEEVARAAPAKKKKKSGKTPRPSPIDDGETRADSTSWEPAGQTDGEEESGFASDRLANFDQFEEL